MDLLRKASDKSLFGGLNKFLKPAHSKKNQQQSKRLQNVFCCDVMNLVA